MEMKKFNYMLKIDILRISSQKNWVSRGVLFQGLGVYKTPCWLRLCMALKLMCYDCSVQRLFLLLI